MCARRLCLLVAFSIVGMVRADEVVLSNGDHVTGTIGTIAGGKMKFTSPALGDLTIDMANVKSYKTDAPATVQLKSGGEVQGRVTEADAGKVAVDGKGDIQTSDIKQINPPPEKWTGSVVVNGMIARGNTHATSLGVDINAILRRDNTKDDDRFTIGAGYFYSRERDHDDGGDNTSADNWNLMGKYDKFWTPKFYGYGTAKVEHDRIANLNYRLSPGVGLGYQWVESPAFNFFTEAGINYVYEEYDPGGHDDHVALRLAYHLDKQLNDSVSLFHNLEYLPAFDDPGDYNLTTDAGIRAKIIQSMFAEFKAEWKRDSTPAPGSEKNDLRYLLGIGWTF